MADPRQGSGRPSVGTPIAIATSGWKPGDPGRRARISGVLAAEVSGCPYLTRGGGHRLWVVWPAGFTARIGGDGRVELIGTDGVVVAREGDHIQAGGTLAGRKATEPLPGIPAGAVPTTIQSTITARPGPSI